MKRKWIGFTFAEVLVTIVILGGAVGTLLTFFVQSIELNNTSRDISLAVSHVQYVLEGIRSSSGVLVTQIDNGVWDYDTDTEFSDRGLTRLPNETIQVEYSGTGALVITVDLGWQMHNGRWQNLTFETVDSGV